MRRSWLLCIFFALTFIFSAFAKELPTDQEELFQYAETRLQKRDWREAERAFETYLERFPKGPHAEHSCFYMGKVNASYAKRFEKARTWLNRFCETYPKSDWYWHARFMIGQTYQSQNLRTRALEVYRKLVEECPDENFRTSAAHTVFSLQDKHLRPYVNQTFSAGANPVIQISSRNVAGANLALYRVPSDEVLERLGKEGLRQAIGAVPPERRKLVKKWRELLWKPKGGWQTKKVTLPVTDAGLYSLAIESDGITFRVAVVINRYGLITKQAAGTLLAFAQDRTTGAPVEGMELRVRAGDERAEGKTDAQGLFLAENLVNGATTVGVKDGEIVTSTSWWNGAPKKQSLFYVFTDRPIYRPNQTVRFKIVHRVEEGPRLDPQPGLKLKITIADTRNNKVHEGTQTLNEWGSCEGEFRLSAEPALGQYTIRVEPQGETPAMQGAWGELGSFGRFRVDEYRKPEFKVGVEFDQPRYIQGETLKATIRADYYFGSPVPHAQVSYRIYRRPHWFTWRKAEAWLAWYGDDHHYGGWGQLVHQGEGKTDLQGRLAVEQKIARDERDYRYTVVAQVTDLSRRRIDGTGGVLASQASFGLRVALDRWVVHAGKPFDVNVVARTYEGEAVADQPVGLRVFHRTWDGKEHQEREVYRATEVRTGADGQAVARVNIPNSGYMRIVAEAKDAAGNRVRAERYLWIASPDWGGGAMRWQGLDLIPDKESYQPGETATFLITAQDKDLHVLFTLESDRIHRHRVVKLNGHTATVTMKLDDPGFIPNVYVAVTAIHGGAMLAKQKNITIDPSHRFCTVEITPDKAQYRPREKAVFQLVARDQAGKPVAAEFALSAVDESIYALQPEFAADMRRFFVRRKWNRVGSASSLQFWDSGAVGGKYGEADSVDSEAMESRAEAPAAAKKGKRQAAFAATEVRSEFADTLLWQPTIVTDADGRATVTIDALADNLTTWRLTARGMGKGGLVGQAEQTVLVRKDVIVRLQTPRFFTQGDRSFVTAVVRNDLKTKKTVKVVLDVEGIEIGGGALVRTIEVKPKSEARLDWTAFVGEPGNARITVKSLTDEESDAMRLDVPVLPYGSPQWTSRAGLVEGTVTEELTLPEGTIREASELLLVVSPSHAATVLDALDYLAGYPYGCVEQTMSRFLPTAVTRQVLQRLDIRKPELEEELPRMLDAGLQRLYGFQHRDGGWGWWKHDQSNPFITAYVVYGLSMAQGADVKVEPRVLARGIEALKKQLETVEDDETRAYVLFALSTAGVKAPDARNALADRARRLPDAQRAMLALVLARDGEAKEANRMLDLLAKSVDEVGAGARWKGTKSYKWTGQSVEVTALALQAFLAIRPDDPLVKKAVTWLALQRDGNHWISTRQTAMVVFAMAEYLKRTGEREPDMTLTLELNGERLYEKRITKENWYDFDGTVKVDGTRLREGRNSIVFKKTGTGTPVYSLYLKRYQKAKEFQPSQGGLRVERKYELVVQAGTERQLFEIEPGAKIKSGDEIQVTLTVKADRPYRYLMLNDPLPAGCEPIREAAPRWYGRHWNHWYAAKEFRDEKVDIAVTYLPEGERTVSYVMRAETPGTFNVLPTLVWNMYRPGEGANSASTIFEVAE